MVLKSANETWERSHALRMRGFDFGELLDYVSRVFGLPPEEILSPGKYRDRVSARSVLCFWAVRLLGMTATELAGRLGVSRLAVSNAVRRGSRITAEQGLLLRAHDEML